VTKKNPSPTSKNESPAIQTGRRIRLVRLQQNMSQAELGKRVGVSFQQIQKYENGMNGLSIERLRQVSEALGVTPHALADFDDNKIELPALSKQTINLLEIWGQLPIGCQVPLMRLFAAMVGNQGGKT
jgi:transcriptional regulator with XRE-family HTH domain